MSSTTRRTDSKVGRAAAPVKDEGMDWEIQEDDKSWVETYRETCRAKAEHPPQFWVTQRVSIQARFVRRSRVSSLRLALASAAALCLIASGLLLTDHRAQPSPVVEPISDQQLLSEVDETISNPLPDALEPVQLIAQDMDRSLRRGPQPQGSRRN